ncbi:MAG: VOC family protein [Candidatus Methylacidiphilales bacterium]|nr:VOC family protein [Candidatus Methylacidiphilales bacterium]
MSTPFIRKGYPAVTPYLIVEGASGLLDFIKNVFGAEEIIVMRMPDGGIAHASVTLNGAVIELSDANPNWPAIPASLHVYVPDTDATFKKALDAGATILMEPTDQFYGERSGSVKDSWGNQWHIATMQEELSNEEMVKRAPKG